MILILNIDFSGELVHTDKEKLIKTVGGFGGYVLDTDIRFMKKALVQARRALAMGEVPIGCVIVHNGKVIARGFNRRNTCKSSIAHAEITAIDRASRKLGDWRLEGCTLYVTLEPCQMCAGAIVQSRIDRVVIATMSDKSGCAGSIINLLDMKEFNHQVEITKGVCAKEAVAVMNEFFEDLRRRNKMDKAMRKKSENAGASGMEVDKKDEDTRL